MNHNFCVLCRTRLVAVATQKFISDIASDSLQYVTFTASFVLFSNLNVCAIILFLFSGYRFLESNFRYLQIVNEKYDF